MLRIFCKSPQASAIGTLVKTFHIICSRDIFFLEWAVNAPEGKSNYKFQLNSGQLSVN